RGTSGAPFTRRCPATSRTGGASSAGSVAQHGAALVSTGPGRRSACPGLPRAAASTPLLLTRTEAVRNPRSSQQSDQEPGRGRAERPPTDDLLGGTLPARAEPQRRTNHPPPCTPYP